jgi:diaminohydroxyphosphoribosylaminopyrimidine deaminase/5-amino-6-(5-phosphoribosylamino)uracil reductase
MDHYTYMQRCFQLAQNGLGTTYPNPLVGCVIVAHDTIIGEGWHRKAGEPHAEVVAINSVKQPELLKEATLYVSLEPCAHYGRTPPCALLIVEKEIPKVVIGCRDPFEEVAGKGIEILQKAGVTVVEGPWAKEAEQLNRRFITFHQKKRPYIILKWAESLDGYVAPRHQEIGQVTAISSKAAQFFNHKWRTEETAILVGANTTLKDNPSLLSRLYSGTSATRIIIDLQAKLPHSHTVFTDEKQSTYWITEEEQKLVPAQVKNWVISRGEELLPALVSLLYKEGIQSLIVEGGPITHAAFAKANFVDEYRIFKSTTLLLYDGISSYRPTLFANTTINRIDTDTLIHSIAD